MRKLNNEINLDLAIAAVENASTGEKPMRNSSKKTPWHLRFAPGALNLKEMTATAGIGALYGLLFAGLLFTPLPPRLASQSNSPTNNSPTNSIPQPQWPRIFGQYPGGWDAMDCDDCDTFTTRKLQS